MASIDFIYVQMDAHVILLSHMCMHEAGLGNQFCPSVCCLSGTWLASVRHLSSGKKCRNIDPL